MWPHSSSFRARRLRWYHCSWASKHYNPSSVVACVAEALAFRGCCCPSVDVLLLLKRSGAPRVARREAETVCGLWLVRVERCAGRVDGVSVSWPLVFENPAPFFLFAFVFFCYAVARRGLAARAARARLSCHLAGFWALCRGRVCSRRSVAGKQAATASGHGARFAFWGDVIGRVRWRCTSRGPLARCLEAQ